MATNPKLSTAPWALRGLPFTRTTASRPSYVGDDLHALGIHDLPQTGHRIPLVHRVLTELTFGPNHVRVDDRAALSQQNHPLEHLNHELDAIVVDLMSPRRPPPRCHQSSSGACTTPARTSSGPRTSDNESGEGSCSLLPHRSLPTSSHRPKAKPAFHTPQSEVISRRASKPPCGNPRPSVDRCRTPANQVGEPMSSPRLRLYPSPFAACAPRARPRDAGDTGTDDPRRLSPRRIRGRRAAVLRALRARCRVLGHRRERALVRR